MKYKVGDKVRVRKDLVVNSNYGKADFVGGMKLFIGKVVTISKVIDGDYLILEDYGDYAWTEEMFEEMVIEAPSITKRINNKHNILNGLLNSGGSVGGKRLIEKLEDNQVQVANGVAMSDRPQRPTGSASTPDDKTKGSHYEKAAMQPLEVMQRVMTAEQFEGFLYGCCLKYLLRKDYKGQRESDEYKARQYAYWLEMVKEGRIINPSKDKVPFDYKFSII